MSEMVASMQHKANVCPIKTANTCEKILVGEQIEGFWRSPKAEKRLFSPNPNPDSKNLPIAHT